MDRISEQGNAAAGVSLSALRDQTQSRINGIHQRLEKKGLGAVFLRAARPDSVGDMGIIGSLLVNMVLCAPFTDFLDSHFHFDALEDFNEAALGGLEGLAAASAEIDVNGRRTPKISAYPEGRRKRKIKDEMKKKFNRAANQNGRYSPDVQAELGSLYEALDMLGSLDDQTGKTRTDRPVQRKSTLKAKRLSIAL